MRSVWASTTNCQNEEIIAVIAQSIRQNLTECHKSKTKIITLANHSLHMQSSEPINRLPTQSAWKWYHMIVNYINSWRAHRRVRNLRWLTFMSFIMIMFNFVWFYGVLLHFLNILTNLPWHPWNSAALSTFTHHSSICGTDAHHVSSIQCKK